MGKFAIVTVFLEGDVTYERSKVKKEVSLLRRVSA